MRSACHNSDGVSQYFNGSPSPLLQPTISSRDPQLTGIRSILVGETEPELLVVCILPQRSQSSSWLQCALCFCIVHFAWVPKLIWIWLSKTTDGQKEFVPMLVGQYYCGCRYILGFCPILWFQFTGLEKVQNVFLAPFFGQKIFINNLIIIGSNPVIVLLLYIYIPLAGLVAIISISVPVVWSTCSLPAGCLASRDSN